MNLFDLGYLVGGVALAPVWARKRRSGWDERFGRIGGMLRRPDRGLPRVVLHAVSVGETSACRALVPLLADHAEVIVSATTDTGLARARSLYGSCCDVVRTPLDFSWAVRRFLDATRPDVLGLVELEVWPNMVRACKARGVPVGVINGRLSERSFRGYRGARGLIGPTFRRLDFAAVQDDTYAGRFLAMGVPAERVRVTGSMKWDAVGVSAGPVRTTEALALGEAMGLDPGRPIVVAGSTAPGEEALLHAAVPPGAQLVCAPRKPEWFDQAAAAMPGSARRSGGRAPAGTERFVLDSIGELSTLYRLADLVVIGRSFGDLYGSDPMEPAGLGRAVLIGPAYGDFAEVVGALLEAGGIRVVPPDRLGGEIAGLLADPDERARMGAGATRCVAEHQGASARHAAILLEHLKSAGSRGPAADRGTARGGRS